MTKLKETKPQKKFFSQQKIFSLPPHRNPHREKVDLFSREKNFFRSKKFFFPFFQGKKIFFAAKNFFSFFPKENAKNGAFFRGEPLKNPIFGSQSQFFAMSKRGIPGFSLFSLEIDTSQCK
jgi:hypothetical protein